MTDTIEVVVVLPCVPVTAIPRRPFISAARTCARMRTGIPSDSACRTSGLSARMAEEITTASG